MIYAALGRTGIRASRIGIGTGTFGAAPLAEEADTIIGRALDLGINVIDTANSYGNQPRFDRPGAPPAAERASAEEIVGNALHSRRHNVLLCTKVREVVGTGPNDYGLSRIHIFDQVEKSLKRLKTDYIDFYYAHHYDNQTRLDQTLRAFDDLIRQGKIRHYALSNFAGWQIMEALWISDQLGLNPPALTQQNYSIARRKPEEDILPVCERYGIGVMAWSPLAGGLLAGPEALKKPFVGRARWRGPGFTEDQFSLANAFNEVARSAGFEPATAAIAWLASRPAVCTALLGAESVAELNVNAASGDLMLPPDVVEAIDALSQSPDTGNY